MNPEPLNRKFQLSLGQALSGPREKVIEDLLKIVRAHGFEPAVTGGLFQLAGELSSLVSKSLLQGVWALLGLLFVIALIVSHSIRVSLAVVTSLALVPITVLGAAGHLLLPLEIISTPGINLAIGLGVDEMIHLVHRSRKSPKEFDLEDARSKLWRPISASCLMLALGFSLFWLSHFPPTRNLGWLVVIGSVMALFVMLLVFPTVLGMMLGKRKEDQQTHEKPPFRQAA